MKNGLFSYIGFISALLGIACSQKIINNVSAQPSNDLTNNLAHTAAASVAVDDAYIIATTNNDGWKLGTEAIELSLAWEEGRFFIRSLRNKLTTPHQEYLVADSNQPIPAFQLTPVSPVADTQEHSSSLWQLQSAVTRQANYQGRPVARFDLTLTRQNLRLQAHWVVFPHTSVIRQWFDVKNLSNSDIQFDQTDHHLLGMNLHQDENPWTVYWLTGGSAKATQGKFHSSLVGDSYQQKLAGAMSREFTPWIGMVRTGSRPEGLFAAIEYLGNWSISVERTAGGPIRLNIDSPDMDSSFSLKGEEAVRFPTITLGVFVDDFDDMAVRLYDWQYEYLWGYTNDDSYALMQWITPWWPDSHNLQENFAGRLGLDMAWVDNLREAGFEVLWDDAGWGEIPQFYDKPYDHVWHNTLQGPDFSQTQKYLKKCGMKWALWFPGQYSPGLMENKIGAWGDFQWRTDSLPAFHLKNDPAWREMMTKYLRKHPRSTLQLCNGGATATHMFDMQNYAHNNQFSDAGCSDVLNYYYSYLEPPDRWSDIINSLYAAWKGQPYNPETSKSLLAMVPCWYILLPGAMDELREISDLYHYLLNSGVCGRWSYMFHPKIEGDAEHYYMQRTSHDRKRALILINHLPPNSVTIYPKGLLEKHTYKIQSNSGIDSERNGAEIMKHGVTLAHPVAGDLLYFNLPDRPGGGADTIPPTAPGRVLMKRECNIGHTGVGIYWSAGQDNNWVSGYEVRRNDKILGKVCTGTYYFDHAADWSIDAAYAVRTLDGVGAVSDWTEAVAITHEPLTYSALGGHFSEAGRDGWMAEITQDGKNFRPMSWIPPAKSPAGDMYGTAQQPGGAEGYWQTESTARIGRGWQQSSDDSMCVRTWQASVEGTIRIAGRVMKEYYCRQKGSNSLRVRILKNENILWPQSGWQTIRQNDIAGAAHILTTSVNDGDRICFVLDKSLDPENDIISWMPVITYMDGSAANDAHTAIRINCGGDQPYTSADGHRWQADQYFDGGRRHHSPDLAATTTRTGEPHRSLYQTGRCGRDFTYTIPLKPGLYSLRLLFAEPEYEGSFQRPFNLDVNGRRVLHNFDICWMARGPRRAYERVLHYLVPDTAGNLVLHFTAGHDPLTRDIPEAIVQGIEILPENKPVVHINVGSGENYVDWNGMVWDGDPQGTDGILSSTDTVDHASPTLHDQALYQTARTGDVIEYSFALPPALYTVHLKFAELWQTEPGARPMNIIINRQTFWENWDPASAAGKTGMAMDLRAQDVAPDGEGRITVRLDKAGTSACLLQGIEID